MRRPATTASLAALLLLVPTTALAAGGGFVFEIHGYYIIDFVVFVGALYFFAKKPMGKFLENRRASVAKEVQEAGEIKSKAEERLARYEKQLASLEDTRKELQDKFTQDGENEKTRALEEASDTAARLEREADRTLQLEEAKLSESLEFRLSARALELAEQKIAEKLTPSVQQALVDQFVADLERIETLADLRDAGTGAAATPA